MNTRVEGVHVCIFIAYHIVPTLSHSHDTCIHIYRRFGLVTRSTMMNRHDPSCVDANHVTISQACQWTVCCMTIVPRSMHLVCHWQHCTVGSITVDSPVPWHSFLRHCSRIMCFGNDSALCICSPLRHCHWFLFSFLTAHLCICFFGDTVSSTLQRAHPFPAPCKGLICC